MTAHPTTIGVLIVLAGSLLVVLSGQGTRTGAILGAAVGAAAVVGFGPGAVAPLAVFVLGSGILTRAGLAAKARLGLAEANRGRRGAAQVLAKLGLPASLGILAALRPGEAPAWRLAYAASLAGAFADTAATESGPLASGPAYALRAGRLVRVAHGVPGGVSLAGLMAGGAAAAAVAGAAWALGVVPTAVRAAVAAALGFAATLLESALGSSPLGARLGHHGRNAAVSVVSAGGAVLADATGWIAS